MTYKDNPLDNHQDMNETHHFSNNGGSAPSRDFAELRYALDESAIVAVTDQTGKITYVNQKFCDISGYTEEELIGQDHRIINSGLHTKEFIRDIWVTIANGRTWRGEICNRNKDGNLYWVDTTIVPLLNDEGKPRQYIAIRYEITERMNYTREIEHLRYALDESAIVATTDVQGRITYVNQKFCDVSGYTQAELIGQDHRIINSGLHTKEFIRDIWVTIANGRTWRGEICNRNKEGNLYWVDTTIVPLLNEQGKPYQYIAIRYEITERVNYTREIESLRYALDESAIVATTDVQGRITYVNQKFQDISGYNEAELIGQDHRIINSGLHPKEFIRDIWVTIANGRTWRGEICNRNKQGNLYWVDTTIVPLLNEDGKPYQYIAIRYEITERMNYTREIEHLRYALDESAIVATTDVQGRITYVNKKFQEISGYNEAELIGQDHRIINSGLHTKEFIRDIWVTIANGRTWRGEICNRNKEGNLYWVDTTIVPLLNEDGKPYQYIAIRYEITERVNYTREIESLRYALDESAIVATTDVTGRITYVNQKFQDISGYNEAELIGQDHRIINSGLHTKEFIRDIWVTIANGKTWRGEICNRNKEGNLYWVDTTIVPLLNEQGKPYQYIAIRYEITERVNYTREIEHLRYALDESAIVATTDVKGRITFVNKKFQEISGYTEEELIGQDHRIINSGLHTKEFIRDIWVTIANGKTWRGEICNRNKQGNLYWVDTTIVPLMNDDGKPYQYIAIRYEITERMNYTREIEDLRYALDESAIVAITDVKGRITYVNKKFQDISGYNEAELIGQDHRIINSGLHTKEFIRDIWVTIANGQTWRGEICNRNKQGNLYWVDTTIVPLLNEQGKPKQYIAIRYEITERKLAEDQIRRRADEIQTVVEVASATNTILDLNELLSTVSNLTKTRFGLYHAHIYLLDDKNENLILAGGAGEAGVQMVKEKRSIPTDAAKSLVARAYRSATPVIVNNVRADETFLPHRLLPNTQSEMALPMVVGREVVGVLDVQSDVVDYFTPEIETVQSILAAQIAAAIRNAQLFEETTQRLRDMSIINAIVETTRGEADLVTTVESALKILLNAFGSDLAIYSTYDPQAQMWQGVAGVGMFDSTVAQTFYMPRDSQPQFIETLEKGVVKAINDVTTYPGFPREYVEQLGMKSELIMPTFTGQQVTGIIVFNHINEYRTFTESDITLARGLANQVSLLIESKKAEIDLQEQSTMISSSHDFMSIITLDQRVQFMNSAGLEMLGYDDPSEIIGKPASLYYPEDLPYELSDGILLELEKTGIWRGETFFHRKDREVFPVELTVFMIYDSKGVPKNIGTVAIDITQRKEIEEELNHLFNNSLDMLGSAGISDGYFKSLNPAWEKVLGWTQEELLSRPYMSIVLPEDVERTNREAMQQLTAGNTLVSFENRVVTKDGGYRWMSWNSYPDVERDIVSFTVRDVTELRAQQETIKRRADELETVAEVSAATTTILDVNLLLKSVSDLTKHQFNLYHAHIYLMNDEGDTLILAAGADEAGDIMVERGHQIPLSNTRSLVVQAALERQAIIVNDVTKSENFLANPLLPDTKAEMAIPMIVGDRLIGVMDVQSSEINKFDDDDAKVKTALASQVAVAVLNAQSFEEIQEQAERDRFVAERLREVDRLKSQFLANMSHELRTPLNSIIGYSEILLDGVDGELEEDAEEDVRTIYDSGKHLLSLINEILDLAKIEAGEMRLDLKPLDLAEEVHDLIKQSHSLVKDKPVEIKVVEHTQLPLVPVDKIRIRQIILNLLSNGVKFTEEGSVTIHLEHDNDYAYITLQDTGIGMSSEQLDVIFERFSQVDGSSTRRAGGSGLGLTITKQLIEMHNGEISVDSTVGEGSVFSIKLPLHHE